MSAGNCDGWSPMTPSAADVRAISPVLARQILAHQEYGERACGWKPAR